MVVRPCVYQPASQPASPSSSLSSSSSSSSGSTPNYISQPKQHQTGAAIKQGGPANSKSRYLFPSARAASFSKYLTLSLASPQQQDGSSKTRQPDHQPRPRPALQIHPRPSCTLATHSPASAKHLSSTPGHHTHTPSPLPPQILPR